MLVIFSSATVVLLTFNTRTTEAILVTRTAKGWLLGAPPAMIFDIFQVLLDKMIRFSAFDRGMMAASKDIQFERMFCSSVKVAA